MIFYGARNYGQNQGGRPVSEAKLRRFQLLSFALIVVLLILSIGGFVIGLYTFLYVDNLHAGAFYPHLLFIVSVIICVIGVVKKSKDKMLISGGVFLLGISCLVAGVGALIDGFHGYHVLETEFQNCSYNPALIMQYSCDSSCQLRLDAETCYCCDKHVARGCKDYSFSISEAPSHYSGVTSCDDVSSTYQTLCWSSLGLNLVCLVVAVVAMGVLNRYKTLARRSGDGSRTRVSHASLGHGSVDEPPDGHRHSRIHYLGGPTVVTDGYDLNSPQHAGRSPPPYA